MDGWEESSRRLHTLLEVEGPAGDAWLEKLARRDPEQAARLRACVDELADIERRNFLGAQPLALTSRATLVGRTVGPYTLDRQLGHGGMGTVWLCHRSDGRYEGQA